MIVNAPIQETKELLSSGCFEGSTVDHEQLKKLGFFIVRGALPSTKTSDYYSRYKAQIEKGVIEKDSYHLTKVTLDSENSLRTIVSEPEVLELTQSFFDGCVGCDWIRVVKKDKTNQKPVFLHQDTPYQIGGFERYSCFTALTSCDQHNGALTLWPGTHNLGYLGDAGELTNFLPSGFPTLTPNLLPGDILIMHSALWHNSGENISGTERVYLEFHIQNINEPTTRYELHGKRTSDWRFLVPEESLSEKMFKSSRVQRIRDISKQNEDLLEKQVDSVTG